MTSIRTGFVAVACAAGLAAGACGSNSGDQTQGQPQPEQAAAQINGAGATFPSPIYSKWFDEYHKLHPNVAINYQSVGSGAGIRQLTNQTVFFGASDGPMTDEQLTAAPGKILHLPTVLGAVVPVYKIADVDAALKFSGPVLADIFLGKIKKWNDPAHREAEPRRQPAEYRHHSRASIGWIGDDLHLDRLPGQGVAGMERQGRRRSVAELAGRRRRQRQRRCVGPGHADTRLDRLRRADLRAAEQDQLRSGPECGRRIRQRRRSIQ